MKTEIKEFIKEQHAEASREWKAEIEKKYPDLFKSEIEVGKWYINKDIKIIIHCTKLTHGYHSTFRGYGISQGEWFNEEDDFLRSYFKPATDKKVKDALIAEAKRRGFKNVGKITIKPIRGDVYPKGEFVTIKNEYEFRNFNLFLDGVLIFHDGKWATIIEEEEEKMISLNEVRERIQTIENELQLLKELLK